MFCERPMILSRISRRNVVVGSRVAARLVQSPTRAVLVVAVGGAIAAAAPQFLVAFAFAQRQWRSAVSVPLAPRNPPTPAPAFLPASYRPKITARDVAFRVPFLD